jgi:uncharacterized protein YggU (UPF0235/DUF167 family)
VPSLPGEGSLPALRVAVVIPGQGFYTVRGRDVVLRVRAKPGSRADRVAGVRGDSLVVEVRAAPERGRANEAVTRVLADALGIKASGIALKTGAASPRKTFILPQEARAAVARLEEKLG